MVGGLVNVPQKYKWIIRCFIPYLEGPRYFVQSIWGDRGEFLVQPRTSVGLLFVNHF